MKPLTNSSWLRMLLCTCILGGLYACNKPNASDASIQPDLVTIQLHEVRSEIRDEAVPVSVILPPGFNESDTDLPLLIHLHGGGGDRNTLIGLSDLYAHMFNDETIPPMVVVSFSSGPGSFYYGSCCLLYTSPSPRDS